MGRSGQIACPSTVFHVVAPTKPVYTIVLVFVKVSSLLLAILWLRLLVLVLPDCIFALPDGIRS
jgi:hypothetical protein